MFFARTHFDICMGHALGRMSEMSGCGMCAETLYFNADLTQALDYALLDYGSHVSLIQSALADQFRLKGAETNFTLGHIGGQD